MIRMCFRACVLALFATGITQAAPIQTYAVFSGGNLTTGSGVQTGAAAANGNVNLGFNNTIPSVSGGGTLTTGGNQVISGSTIFNGNISLAFGSQVGGPIHSGGTVSGGGGLTVGNVFQANAAPINLGFGSSSGTLNSGAVAPQLQSFAVVSFPAASPAQPGGAAQSTGFMGALPIAPGNYGALTTGSQATITLTAGDYNFDSVNIGFDNTININLAGGNIRIVVGGSFALGTSVDWNITGGTAANVYLEIQNAGTTNLPFDFNFKGTLYLPMGNVNTGSSTVINGALWAGGNVFLDSGTKINYVASNALPGQFAPAGPGATEVPEPTTIVLWGAAAMFGYAVRRRQQAA